MLQKCPISLQKHWNRPFFRLQLCTCFGIIALAFVGYNAQLHKKMAENLYA